MNKTVWSLMIVGCLMAPSLATAATCDGPSDGRAYYISAPTQGDDWPSIDGVAVGGAGTLALVIAQQAGTEGYRSLTIDETGITTSGIDAELIANDLVEGQVSFRACSEQGFLVQAVYLNEEGLVAGVPADVLASTFEKNFANVTAKSNDRIGVKFNSGGAEGALAILNTQLQAIVADAAAQFGALISGLEISLERVIAELVLTENVASVFDLSESQAPVIFPVSSDCFVQDHVVVHPDPTSQCVGRMNAAVDEVVKLTTSGNEVPLNLEAFETVPNEIYVAKINEASQRRQIVFVSQSLSPFATAYSNDPLAPTPLSFSLGENVVSGQVDDPRNTRDFFGFAVPEGAALTGIYLDEWSSGIDQGFVHIDSGQTSVIPSQETSDQFLGGAHISASLFGPDDNLLSRLAEAPQGGVGFVAPLQAGSYVFNIQQTANVPSRYRLVFVLESL